MSRPLSSYPVGKAREAAVSRRLHQSAKGMGYWAARDYKDRKKQPKQESTGDTG